MERSIMSLSQQQAQRYIRQITLKEIGLEGQKKLLNSKVLIIGLGGLGSVSAMYLAAAGVGNLGLADYDTVDLSNLQRQIIHKTKSNGMKKTLSAQNTIKEINPEIKTIIYDEKISNNNIEAIIKEYDFIIDATDKFENKFLINDACVLNKKPYSHAGVVKFQGQTFTYLPEKSPCLRCFMEDTAEDREFTCSQAGILGASAGVIGSVQTAETVKYLTGIGELLTHKVLFIDLFSMTFRTVNIDNPAKNCPICSKTPQITSLKDFSKKGCCCD
ncbi:MAG: HesA/MoeB/ThiF family protein [Candidatus Gastranaerophilales bacterium]|nr:HesA/MoeB/ThiF family protein [Candidatus Gastranaerophilales bacterium]